MPQFSVNSITNLADCHQKLRVICQRAIRLIDFKVICGWRGQKEQHEAFITGKSKLDWPKSAHNRQVYMEIMKKWIPESFAVDLAPWPIDYWSPESTPAQIREGNLRFYFLAGAMQAVAAEYGIPLRWGGDWNSNGIFIDETFRDIGHFELLEEK